MKLNFMKGTFRDFLSRVIMLMVGIKFLSTPSPIHGQCKPILTDMLRPNYPTNTGWFGTTATLMGDDLFISGATNAGAQVFAFSRIKGHWVSTGGMVPNNLSGGITDFGCCVATDSEFAVVGARLSETSQGVEGGAVLVYKRSPANAWQFAIRLPPTNPSTPGARFGTAVAIKGDMILAGAPRQNTAADAVPSRIV